MGTEAGEGMSRRSGRHFSEQGREDCGGRRSVPEGITDTADAPEAIWGRVHGLSWETIDSLADVLTGNRAYFQEKLPPSSPSVQRD